LLPEELWGHPLEGSGQVSMRILLGILYLNQIYSELFLYWSI